MGRVKENRDCHLKAHENVEVDIFNSTAFPPDSARRLWPLIFPNLRLPAMLASPSFVPPLSLTKWN